MWQLCICGLDGKNHVVKIKSNEPEKTTVKRLKELVHEETGIEPQHQRLLYGPKQMEDDKRLCDYPPLASGASILLVLRLPGGGNMFRTHRERKVSASIPRSGEECMITLSSGNSVLKMPCGHPMSPDGLMEYCWSEIKDKKFEIKCPLCAQEWPLEVIKRYGGASDTETTKLEKDLAHNACLMDPNTQKCPFCGAFCTRLRPTSNNVKCVQCTRKCSKEKEFCWICLQPWIAESSTAAKCGNKECDVTRSILRRLKESPMIEVTFLKKKVYKYRVCPKCGTMIELESGCKHMECTACRTEFCFICLRQRVCGNWPCGRYDTPCELAPIQTVLPNQN